MKVLVIYDATGRIWAEAYEELNKPEGVPSMFVDIPDGSIVDRIDVSDPENHKPVFSFIPDSNIGALEEKVIQNTENLSVIQRQMETVMPNNYLFETAIGMMTMSFTDEQALQVKSVYPIWSALAEGTQLTKQEEATTGTEITKVLGDDGKLYKVNMSHKKQSDWVPGIETAALFVVIDEQHAGTIDDPIPAAANMIYYEGKYYDEEGTLYLCTRDSEVALQYLPSQLVGSYFELALV